MYQKEFENLLRSTPPRAMLFYGENPYLIEGYIEHYIRITDASDSLLRLYFDEYTFDRARAYLSQVSLFGGTNLLIIKRDKKIPKKELELLLALVKKSPNNFLLFEYRGKVSDAKSLQSSFSPKKGGNWLRVFEPNIRDSIILLEKKAQLLRVDIDRYTLQHLLLLLNNNLTLCANELNKLAILKGKVNINDIDRLVYSTAPLIIEQLLIQLFEKKPIVETISKLLDLGEDEFSILRSTQFFVNQIFLFHSYIKIYGNIDSKAILGYKLPKQIENQKGALAVKMKSSTLLKIYEHLLEVELEIKKSSSGNRELLLYGAFIKIQNLL